MKQIKLFLEIGTVSQEPKVNTSRVSKDKQKDFESAFNEFKSKYILHSVVWIERNNLIEPDTITRILELLKEARGYGWTEESLNDKLKDIIKCVARTPVDVIFNYANMQRDMVDFIVSAKSDVECYECWRIIDKAYSDVFIESGGML